MKNQLLLFAFILFIVIPGSAQISFQPLKLNQFTGNQVSGNPATYTNGILIQSLQAGDFDNDGDLDLAIRATNNDTGSPFATLYVNKSTPGNFVIQQSSFDFIFATRMHGWTDLNNDGFVDLIGSNGNAVVVYFNNAGLSFTYANLFNSAASITKLDWGDFDNDGDIDFLCQVGGVYRRNADGSYTQLGICGDCKFVDYDADSDLDLSNGDAIYSYQNGGYVQTHKLLNSCCSSVSSPEFVFQDLNGDGKPDYITSYRDEPFGGGGGLPPGLKGSEYWTNTNNQYSRESNFQSIFGFPFAISNPVDLNHNGKHDIIYLSNGQSQFDTDIYRIYEVGGPSSFQLLGQFNPGIINTTAYAVGDFDKDGRIDFISAGNGSSLPYFPGTGVFAYFFRNLTSISNQAPSQPLQLTQFSTGDETTLTWQQATDDITPQNSIQYNLYLRRGADTVFTSNSLANGKRKVSMNGNTGTKNSHRFKGLPQGVYHWSVQSMDASYRTSSFANELSFSIETGETPLNQVNGTTVKAIADNATGDYTLAISQNGMIAFRRVDSNAQLIFSKATTIESTLYEMVLPDNGNEIMLVWVDNSGTWAQGFDKSSLTQTTAKALLSPDLGYSEISIAYNSTEDNYVALVRKFVDSGGVFPDSNMEAILFKKVNQQIEARDKKLLVKTINGNFDFKIIDHVNIGYEKSKNVFVISWAKRELWDTGQICCKSPETELKVQLLNSSLGLLGSSLSIANSTSFQAEVVKMNSGRDNKFLLVWGRGFVNGFTYSKAINGAVLAVNGTIGNPTLSSEELANGISFVRQGITSSGSESPVLAFNSRRNEFTIAWKSLYDNGSVKYQRYDVVDKRLVLSEEALFPSLSNPAALTFNAKSNEFLLPTFGIFYTRFSTSKDPYPIIVGISAGQAYAGDTIVLNGGFFSKTPSLNKVFFGETPAIVTDTYQNGTQLEVIVPPGLGRTPIPVTVDFDDQSTTSTFFFENLTLHAVTAMDLTVGERGDLVTITGDKFPIDPAQVKIKFGTMESIVSDIVNLTSTEIKVKIPQAALRGTWPVTVVIQGQEVAAPNQLRVIVPPTITSISASEDFISCKSVTIQGTNFSSAASDLLIKFGNFNALPADLISTTSSTIIVKVPIGAEGNIPVTVTVDDRIATTSNQQVYLGSSISLTSPAPANSILLTSRKDDGVNVQLRVRNQCSVQEAKLWTKGISEGNSAWKNSVLTLESNRADARLDETQFTDAIGLNVMFEIDDLSGKKVYSDTFFIHKNFAEFDSTNNVPELDFGGDVSDYSIISIPYQLTPNNIPSVFKDLVNKYGSDSSKWRLFHYLNTDTQDKYIEYTRGLDKIEPGKGYWMIVRYPQEIFIDGARAVDLSSGPFEITMQPGWNQIGNPYNFTISWADVLTFNKNPANLESLKVIVNGTLQNGTTLPRFRGGFVKYNGTTPLVLKIPYAKNNSLSGGRIAGAKLPSNFNGKQWYVPFTLSSSTISNETVGVGMHPQALEGADALDETRLPRFFNQLDVAFAENLASSFVPTSDQYTWEFDVHNATADKNLTLTWPSDSFGDNDRLLYLYDLNQERIVDMRAESIYTFSFPASKKFKLVYGDRAYIEEHLVPERDLLGAAYPNPFNAATLLPFTITRNHTHVTLKIYNVLGQEVKTLLDEPLDAGFYEILWNGTDQSGSSVQSGTFIYQLQSSEGRYTQSQSRKLIFK